MKICKFISVFLIICILFNVFPLYTVISFNNIQNSSEINLTNSLHFIITHWHDVPGDDNLNTYTVPIEGYIVPNENNTYSFYFLNDETNELVELTENISSITPYIESIDKNLGTIILNINPIYDENGIALERFSGFSISAGHSAIDSGESNDTIKISYNSNIHLVKAHVFYSNECVTVYGSGNDDAVFGSGNIQNNLEQDTMWVYAYIRNVNNFEKGDIVKDDNNNPVFDSSNLPNSLVEGVDVAKVKIYSTIEGLHTDKTATAIDDRTFNIDLESWFSGAPTANIGLVLDSSGSMSFTSDELTPININDFDLSDEQKQLLSSKILNLENYPDNPTTENWVNNIFLNNEEINYFLNPHNTDNSKLSASNYSYYVFDGRPSVNEYVALGYWNGSINNISDKIIGYYKFERGSSNNPAERDWLLNSATGKSAKLVNQIKSGENISFQETTLPENWTEDSRIKFDTNNGLCIKNIENGVGVLLDAIPSSDNFTISFSIKKDPNSNDTSGNQNYTDILYIGDLNNDDSSNYFRGIRDGNNEGSVSKQGTSSSRFKGYNNELIGSNIVSNINSVFSSANTSHIITLVFSDGRLSTYMDGNIQDTNKDVDVNLSARNIIFNGFNNGYNGANLFVENVVVLDSSLEEADVKVLNSLLTGSDSSSEYIVYNNSDSLDSIGVVANNFVDNIKGMTGWYYINYDSSWSEKYLNKDIQSCKKFWGISGNNDLSFKDIVTSANSNALNNTEYVYEPKNNTPTCFYIDKDGYLRCFFASGTKKDVIGTSLVYFKDDSKYIKSEALQQAIGNFSRRLNDVSPSSKISAVRFSSDKVGDDDLDKLVLLDWTNDILEEQRIMSLNRGTGGTIDGTLSNPVFPNSTPIVQYNYGITGGTATYTGLKSFYNNLYSRADESAAKYLVIFTDGKDSTTDDKKQEAISIASDFKNAGYTIFAIMLTGGSVEKNEDANSEYQQAKNFLLQLVGTSDSSEYKEDFFFSTLEGEKSIDSLTEIFTNNILKRITYNLLNYNVQDYIDPRFDLVSADGNIYNLNADGNVIVKNSEGSVIEQYNLKNEPLSVKLSNNYIVDEEARIANLYFDIDNNMYYLKWVNQTIPGCTVNASRLPVWNAQITLRAKDDLIGGNAILTNGNLSKMNYIFHDGDADCSSGVNDVLIGDSDVYPSKGFPRVTVNVGASENSFNGSQTIYLGESININDYSENLFKNAYTQLNNSNLYYYLEYLERYALLNNENLIDYENSIISGNKVRIPYYYIDNIEHSNQTGTIQHKGDLLGYIEYKLTPIATEDTENFVIVEDMATRKMFLNISYIPLDINLTGDLDDENFRESQLLNLVTDDYYLWNSKYKPVQGNIVNDKHLEFNHSIDVVSGKIALKIVFTPDVQVAIGDNELIYQIDLVRNYQNVTKKVGTFKAVYSNDSLPEPDANGNLTIVANLTYDDDNAYMTDYGLPIGKYTLQNPIITTDASLNFDMPVVVVDSSLYTKSIFNLDNDTINLQDYIASFDNNTIILGDINNTARDYTDYRYGLLEVIPTVIEESNPTPVEPEPTPDKPDPTPVEPEPTPDKPDPTPVEPDPTPDKPDPAPVEPKPTDATTSNKNLPQTGNHNIYLIFICGLAISSIICTVILKISIIREER